MTLKANIAGTEAEKKVFSHINTTSRQEPEAWKIKVIKNTKRLHLNNYQHLTVAEKKASGVLKIQITYKTGDSNNI